MRSIIILLFVILLALGWIPIGLIIWVALLLRTFFAVGIGITASILRGDRTAHSQKHLVQEASSLWIDGFRMILSLLDEAELDEADQLEKSMARESKSVGEVIVIFIRWGALTTITWLIVFAPFIWRMGGGGHLRASEKTADDQAAPPIPSATQPIPLEMERVRLRDDIQDIKATKIVLDQYFHDFWGKTIRIESSFEIRIDSIRLANEGGHAIIIASIKNLQEHKSQLNQTLKIWYLNPDGRKVLQWEKNFLSGFWKIATPFEPLELKNMKLESSESFSPRVNSPTIFMERGGTFFASLGDETFSSASDILSGLKPDLQDLDMNEPKNFPESGSSEAENAGKDN